MKNTKPKIVQAFEFAYVHHAGSKRKGTQIPYIAHPLDVAVILMKNHASEDMIVAGLLQYIIEEEDIELIELEKAFGKEVAHLVNFSTEPEELRKSDSKQTWDVRKQHTIDKIETATKEEKLLACADKLANIRDVINDHKRLGNQLWERFNAPVEKQQWYYQSVCKAFTRGEGISNNPVFNQFKECVLQLFP